MDPRPSSPPFPNESEFKHSHTDPSGYHEEIEEDDLCPICHLLLYNPIKTICNHTLCSICMAHWADVSITTNLIRVGLNDSPMVLLPNQIETKCPMCRTFTDAQADRSRTSLLQNKYPQLYQQRKQEESGTEQETGEISTLTLYIGNKHNLIQTESGSQNKHSWKFFVTTSASDLLEMVVVHLHPTFRNPTLVLETPPYEIRRLGWGYFTITADVILKEGYSWICSEAEDTPNGRYRGMLSLDWTLDFDGQGSQGRCRLKVRRENSCDNVNDGCDTALVPIP